MPEFKIDENMPILVEFTTGPHLERVALSKEDLLEESTKALKGAMNTIHGMAQDVITTINSLAKRPSKVEVSFGIKLDAKAGALIAQVGGGASINIKLTWQGE